MLLPPEEADARADPTLKAILGQLTAMNARLVACEAIRSTTVADTVEPVVVVATGRASPASDTSVATVVACRGCKPHSR